MKFTNFGRFAGLTALTALATLSPLQGAQAATASVQMDWGSFQITVFDNNLADGITPTLEWVSQTSQINTVVDGIGWLPIDTVSFDWLASGTDIYSAPGLDLTGIYSIDMLFAEGSGNLSTGGVVRAERWGVFTVTGDARIEASIQATVYASMSPAEMANGGYIQADANLFFGDNTGTALSSVDTLNSDLSGVVQNRLLSVSFEMNGGSQAYLYLQPGVAVTAVPEPASVGMMLAGLGLLAGRFSRRRIG